jgi:hypothetical protein
VIEILFFLHAVVVFGLYRLLKLKVGRIIALVFLVYMTAFTIVKPALLYYFGLFLPYSTNDYSVVVAMLSGSLLFLSIQYAAVKYFSGYRPARLIIQWFDFSRANQRGIWLTFIFLGMVSFIGSTIKFDDAGYLWSTVSNFDATTNQASGSYYIDFLAEALFYGAIMVMAFYCSKMPPAKSFALLIVVLVFTYIWAKLAARSGVLVVLIAWLSCSLSAARQRSLNIMYIALFGYFLLMLLYVGNLVRLGNLEAIDPSRALFGAAIAAVSDLAPVDSAALLYSDMSKHESTKFLQLAGAITPMVLIPSSIFPLKIPADKDSELTRMFFPEGVDTTFYHEGSNLTFTIPGSGFADAGFVGVAVSSVVYALLFCVYIWIYRRGSASAKFVAAVYMLIHIVGYRLSVEALLMTFYSAFLFFGIARWLALVFSALMSSESRSPSAAET